MQRAISYFRLVALLLQKADKQFIFCAFIYLFFLLITYYISSFIIIMYSTIFIIIISTICNGSWARLLEKEQYTRASLLPCIYIFLYRSHPAPPLFFFFSLSLSCQLYIIINIINSAFSAKTNT